MDFSLRCAYAHGTAALRTHLDSIPPQDAISWPVFEEMRERWKGRIELQGVCAHHHRAGARARLVRRLLADRVAARARRDRRRDLHAARPRRACSTTLCARRRIAASTSISMPTRPPTRDAVRARRIADAVHRNRLPAGCSSAIAARWRVRPTTRRERTSTRSPKAGIAVVSLPMCNMYLQDRRTDGTHAALARRHAAARDEGARHPGRGRLRQHPRPVLRLWRPRHARGACARRRASCISTTRSPTGAHAVGRLATPRRRSSAARRLSRRHRAPARRPISSSSAPANWTELLSRPQSDRIVLRANGARASTGRCPTIRELDDLMEWDEHSPTYP